MTELDKAVQNIDPAERAKEMLDRAEELQKSAEEIEIGEGADALSKAQRDGQAREDLEQALKEPLETLRRVAQR